MVTTKDIREHAASYLANGIDLDTFEDWVAQRTWNLHRLGDIEAQHLAYSVELLLSEHSSGDLSESALRQKMSLLLQAFQTGSSNHSIPVPIWQPWQRVDIRDAVVFG